MPAPVYARLAVTACTLLLSFAPIVLAQGQPSEPPAAVPAPAPGEPRSTIPERMDPDARSSDGASSGTGDSLSERLGRSGGVIRPPNTGPSDIIVPAPVPEPNTTPVIPPMGTPGSPSPAIPK